jgi:hypothetical protein
MSETTVVRNPYVGPRTFEEAEADRFFGREREARELVALVVNERLTLFYAQSGAGKSSLINARLIPQLRDVESFAVLPVGRVSGVVPDGVDPTTIDNIFVYHLILGLSQKLAERAAQSADDTAAGPPDLQHTSLARFLSGESGPDPVTETDHTGANPPAAQSTEDLMPHVLIIDQFEELLTTYPDRWQERVRFFEQLNIAMTRHPNLWVVLTLREDYVASLEPFSHLTPNRLRARFYMQRMGIEAAREAIERPAANAERPFAEGVAGRLVDNLRMVRTAGQNEYHAGEYVEPVQLQVVCFQLWQDLRDRPAPTIQLGDLERLAGGGRLAEYVDRALSDFYEKAITKVVETAEVGVTEPVVRKWFSDELITEAGTRSIVFRNETTGKTEGLPNQAVDLLAAQFLLRTELRAGGAWVELVHDRLVEPIRDSNAAWLKQNQGPLQRQAAIWRDEGKPPDRLLLTAEDLTAAERWAAAHERELEPHEVEFLGVSKAARDALERELAAQREVARQRELESAQALAEEQRRRADEQARAANRLRTVATAAVAFALLAITAMGVAWIFQGQARESEEAAVSAATAEAIAVERAQQSAQAAAAVATAQAITQEAVSTQLAAQAEQMGQIGSLDQALLLGAEALRAADTPVARQIIETLLLWWPEAPTYLHAHDAPVGSLSFSRDGQVLISGDETGRLVMWSVASGELLRTPSEPDLGAIQAVALEGTGNVWAAGTSHGPIRMWEQAQRQSVVLDGHADAITDLVFSFGGEFLASASLDGTARLWSLRPPARAAIPLEAGTGPVTAISFGPKLSAGPIAATGSDGGQVWLWTDLDAQRPASQALPIGEVISATVSSLAFDEAGARLGIGFDDGQFIAWDLARQELAFAPVDASDGSVGSLAFDPQDDTLVVLFANGSLNRYTVADLAAGRMDPIDWSQPVAGTMSAALTPDGRTWAIGLDTGAVILGSKDEPSPLDANPDREALINQACRIVNRNLYEIEWRLFIGEEVPYRETCPTIEPIPARGPAQGREQP